MARAAFFSLPASGHVNPTLPLVEELVRRGERVDYYCSAPFRSAIERTGARFCETPRTLDGLEKTDPFEGLFLLGEFVAQATLEVMPLLESELKKDPPDYILHDTMTPWGRLLAQRLRLPAVSTFPSFAALPEKSPLPPLPILLLVFGPKNIPLNLRRLRRRRELTQETSQRYGVDDLNFANLITNPQPCNIVFTSERFQQKRAMFDDRFHFVGSTLSEAPDPTFPFSELEGRRVIYVSLGTVFNDKPDFFRACLDAFDREDEVVVIGAGKRMDITALGKLPKNAIVRPHVPQLEVLRRAALFITHGGMNSVTAGMYYRVPMLVRPQGADNFTNANRLQELGAGRKISSGDLKPHRLRKLAETMIADANAKRVLADLGESLRSAGGAKRAADVVLAFREQHAAQPV
jgi:MGT family glycosyltransferase